VVVNRTQKEKGVGSVPTSAMNTRKFDYKLEPQQFGSTQHDMGAKMFPVSTQGQLSFGTKMQQLSKGSSLRR